MDTALATDLRFSNCDSERITGNSETSGLETRRGDVGLSSRNSRADVLGFSVQRPAAAISVLMGFFRFGILASEIGEGHVQRLVSEADSKPALLDRFRPLSGWPMTRELA